jgi:hypothetical protein
MKYAALLAFVIFCGCSPYRAVKSPLKGVSNDCRCKYEQLAVNYYRHTLTDLIHDGLPDSIAVDSAQIETHRYIGRIQLAVMRGAVFSCGCNGVAGR